MVDFNAWRTTNDSKLLSSISDETRAASLWALIQRDPVSITIYRNGSAISAQTVRIVIQNSGDGERRGEANAVSGMRMGIVYGIKNHATLTDTDIQIGDMFALNANTDTEETHRVIDIVSVPGGIEAYTEVIQ